MSDKLNVHSTKCHKTNLITGINVKYTDIKEYSITISFHWLEDVFEYKIGSLVSDKFNSGRAAIKNRNTCHKNHLQFEKKSSYDTVTISSKPVQFSLPFGFSHILILWMQTTKKHELREICGALYRFCRFVLTEIMNHLQISWIKYFWSSLWPEIIFSLLISLFLPFGLTFCVSLPICLWHFGANDWKSKQNNNNHSNCTITHWR